ncbi:MAG: hypothetical protein ABL874_13645 [Sphingopyxis sp.]
MATQRRPRQITAAHLPYVVSRSEWAMALSLPAVLMLFAGLCWMISRLCQDIVEHRGWFNLSLVVIMIAIILFLVINGLDRSFGYRLVIERKGVRVIGLLFRRNFTWHEITDIQWGHNHQFSGFHTSIKVDGSHNPKRHWSSLWSS